MEKVINQRIANTDIFVFGYNPETKLFAYSRPFTADEANVLAKETNQIIQSQYKGVNGLRGELIANDNGELTNMCTLKGIVANRTLKKITDNQQAFPTIEEGTRLQRFGMLPSGVLIDFGIALYNEKNPDEEIAQKMIITAKQEKYITPVLASFNSLDLEIGGKRYGVIPILVSKKGLVDGKEAEKLLKENSFYVGNSGVHGLYRGRDDNWNAGWGDSLDGFDEGCRVGRFSAKGSAQKLEKESLGAFIPVKKSLDSILALAR